MLVYEPASPNRRPISIARVVDADLLSAVARKALAEAERRLGLAGEDPVLKQLEQSELDRLQRLLELIIPEPDSLRVN